MSGLEIGAMFVLVFIAGGFAGAALNRERHKRRWAEFKLRGERQRPHTR